uniref:Uncharacterized protein n=1 Tax=Oryza punctata TaxID=4537 RepID=A0A0E0JH92_ORYPU
MELNDEVFLLLRECTSLKECLPIEAMQTLKLKPSSAIYTARPPKKLSTAHNTYTGKSVDHFLPGESFASIIEGRQQMTSKFQSQICAPIQEDHLWHLSRC